MAPQRSGALPVEGLVNFCFQSLTAAVNAKPKMTTGVWRIAMGGTRHALLDRIQRHGGLLAYLGTDDIREVERRIDAGNQRAKLIYDAMIYQIAKEIGAYGAVLRGKIDAVVLTGGMTLSPRLVRQLKSWISYLAPRTFVFPGKKK